MVEEREVQVHLLPDLVPRGRLAGGLAVVIDVLRATTTIVHAQKGVHPVLANENRNIQLALKLIF